MPSASALIYLFGDLFAQKAVIQGVSLPWRNAKVNEHHLAIIMFVAEFVVLSEKEQICLQFSRPGQSSPESLHATFLSVPPSVQGLEREILCSASVGKCGDDDQEDIRAIVWRALKKDSLNPWTVPSEFALEELVQGGYLTPPDHHVPVLSLGNRHRPILEKISSLECQARELKAQLDSFRDREPLNYSLLWDNVCRGFYARQECGDL
jgi:hypothetical protein